MRLLSSSWRGQGVARSPAGADILICSTVASQPPLTFLCLACHIAESTQPRWPLSDSLPTPDPLLRLIVVCHPGYHNTLGQFPPTPPLGSP